MTLATNATEMPAAQITHGRQTVDIRSDSARRRGRTLVAFVAGIGLAVAVVVVRIATPSAAIDRPNGPMPAEFRLGPSNQQPPGIAVPLSGSNATMPGEFRLGPGNAEPMGIVVPLN
jgi:hypothetical protein